MAPNKPVWIEVSQGMSGHFAVMMHTHEEGFAEPWDTGIGRYATREEAVEEARGWAEGEGVECRV